MSPVTVTYWTELNNKFSSFVGLSGEACFHDVSNNDLKLQGITFLSLYGLFYRNFSERFRGTSRKYLFVNRPTINVCFWDSRNDQFCCPEKTPFKYLQSSKYFPKKSKSHANNILGIGAKIVTLWYRIKCFFHWQFSDNKIFLKRILFFE